MRGYVAKGDEAEGRVTTAVNDTVDWLDRQWQDFLAPTANASEGTGTARLITVKGARSDHYRVAIDGFEAHPLIGGGAGSFEVRYARDRNVDVKIRDVHSLPLEILANSAPLGMLLLLGFIGAVATAARRTIGGKGVIRPAEAAAVSAAFVIWLAHACVDWDWEMPVLTGIPSCSARRCLAWPAPEVARAPFHGVDLSATGNRGVSFVRTVGSR